MNLILPPQVLAKFNEVGIMSIGERHGIRENYEIIKSILDQLFVKPHLAVEMGYLEKIEFEKFKRGEEVDGKNISDKARISLEYFQLLKNYVEQNPQVKILFFQENTKNSVPKSYDEQYADFFLENFEKPILIISGETHARKEVINFSWGGPPMYPMCYFIKNQLGDFPMLKFFPASGTEYRVDFDKSGINSIPDQDVQTEVFTEIGENSYLYYYPKATPITPFLD